MQNYIGGFGRLVDWPKALIASVICADKPAPYGAIVSGELSEIGFGT
jgi:hypothetical protein